MDPNAEKVAALIQQSLQAANQLQLGPNTTAMVEMMKLSHGINQILTSANNEPVMTTTIPVNEAPILTVTQQQNKEARIKLAAIFH